MFDYLKTYIEILMEYKIEFLIGLGTTLLIAVISLFFAVLIGVSVGYINFVPTKKKNFTFYLIKTLQWIGKEYIDLIRGTPLLVQAIFFYFGVVPIINKGILGGQQMSPEIAGIIIISLNAGAFLAEIFRGGIQAIDAGQMEAARSLGLSFGKAMRKVILPQAIKNMIPAILNQFITSLKDTSLLMVIGVADLMGKGQIAFKTNYKTFETMLIIALIYYLVIKILSTLFKKIEGKLKV
ncbi:amino acid ABC transporter permease [Leptotrichia sp. HSP-342]|uniref:Amino acid ABC transporter permease n=1 Tax=Leptotrichia mesophila TaxID=3239303 RepID=A0AB39VAU1_9FUSO